MKNLLNEEIKRIFELMNVKGQLINEDWITGLLGKLGSKLAEIKPLATKYLSKTINTLSDLTDDDFKSLLKSLQKGEGMALKTAFIDAVSDYAGITVDQYKRMTNSKINETLILKGLSPEEIARFKKWFKGANKVQALDDVLPNKPKIDVGVEVTKKSFQELADDLLKKFSKEEAQEFVNKINLITSDEKFKKMLLIDSERFFRMSLAELQQELTNLQNQLSKAQMNKVRTILTKIGIPVQYLTGKNVVKAVSAILALMLGGWAIKNVNKVTGTTQDLDKINPLKDEKPEENKKGTGTEAEKEYEWRDTNNDGTLEWVPKL